MRIDILGVGFDCVTMSEALARGYITKEEEERIKEEIAR